MKTIQKMKLAIFLIIGISFFKCEDSMQVENDVEKMKIVNNTALDVKIKTYSSRIMESSLKDTFEIAAYDSLIYKIYTERGVVSCASGADFAMNNDSIVLLFSDNKTLAFYGSDGISMGDYKNYDCEEIEGEPTTFIYTIDLDDYNLAE